MLFSMRLCIQLFFEVQVGRNNIWARIRTIIPPIKKAGVVKLANAFENS